MDTSASEIVLSSLRYALLGKKMPEDTGEKLTPAVFRQAIEFCQKQNVLHLLAFSLKDSGFLPAGEEAAAAEKSLMMALYQTERIEHERRVLCALLEEAGIRHIALKGAVIRSLYPETWMRTSSDADVLVPKERLEEAAALLQEKRGYRLLERGSHDLAFAAPGETHMELHFSLLETDRLPRAGAVCRRVWEFARPCPGKKYEFLLSAEFFYFYHLAHMAKHLNNGGVGIRFFLDLYLIRTKTEMDEAVLSRLLEEGGLAEFERVSLALARYLLEGEKLTEEASLLMDFVFSNSIFGQRESYVAIRRGRKGKLRYLWERLFAPYDTLCGIYPALQGKRYLLFFYQIRRIYDHIRSGRLSSSKEELRENFRLSEKEAEKTARLLRALKLEFYD